MERVSWSSSNDEPVEFAYVVNSDGDQVLLYHPANPQDSESCPFLSIARPCMRLFEEETVYVDVWPSAYVNLDGDDAAIAMYEAKIIASATLSS